MFEYIQGTVDSVKPSGIVLDVNGVGFEIQADTFSKGAAKQGENMRLYTQMRVAEDRITLYGFQTQSQRELFLKLTAVSGVGPKVAIAVLSHLSAEDLVNAVLTEDEKALQGVPGVGKKTAQRMLLELKGKVDLPEGSDIAALAASGSASADAATDAAEALEGLGYTRQEAVKAVAAVQSLADTAEDLVRLALKRFGLK